MSESKKKSKKNVQKSGTKRFLKSGKVVIVLAGRYAGKKAIIVKAYDEGSKERPFPHALVAGIDRYPLKVAKAMSKAKILKRSAIKPFVKHINYQHLMPTRYQVDIEVKQVVIPGSLKKLDTRVETRKDVKKLFQQRYLERGKNTLGVQYFFKKLRF
mmetsp:Transcript_3688/g.7891  ORF Transcript_3688/g.7891 Transcript_3688/m.7891 type:complete len:157 (-) Transcript_3688:76-546(-)|eukprot:CAMPEP_0183353458 /NCGR_PEP_ID=MMETSP0164_2-20130417/33265_1 /TAXON_ID=221442 /ORGANISM="Coccolithus pelagicus ssp braarudi, Strain PLY182g" /LENGTH=156 /DNA_ID=CAMNT_0025526129 /DNA_START=67 /DNA_END=537 /DNA_ORIENTATION=-